MTGGFAPPRALAGLVVAASGGACAAEPAATSTMDGPAPTLAPGAATFTEWDRDRSLLPEGFGLARDPGHDSPEALIEGLIEAATDGGDAPPWVGGWIVSEGDASAVARVIVPATLAGEQYLATEFLLDLTKTLTGWRVRLTHVRFHCLGEVRDTFYCQTVQTPSP
jgi:hypothetical protein